MCLHLYKPNNIHDDDDDDISDYRNGSIKLCFTSQFGKISDEEILPEYSYYGTEFIPRYC